MHARRWTARGISVMGACAFALLACDDDGSFDARAARGLQISPVPMQLGGHDARLAGVGSYIVNAQGACSDCHTWPNYAAGGDPFQGQTEIVDPKRFLAGGRPFGPITAPNITPDASGRPGGLTLRQFIDAIRTGRDPDEPNRLLQVMPWPVYRKMTDSDLVAVYEYLSTIPPIRPGTAQ